MSKEENKKKLCEQFDNALATLNARKVEITEQYELKLNAIDAEIELVELQKTAIKKV